MYKKTNNKKRGRAAFARKRKPGHGKRRARVPEKDLSAKNYALERHPEMYL